MQVTGSKPKALPLLQYSLKIWAEARGTEAGELGQRQNQSPSEPAPLTKHSPGLLGLSLAQLSALEWVHESGWMWGLGKGALLCSSGQGMPRWKWDWGPWKPIRATL